MLVSDGVIAYLPATQRRRLVARASGHAPYTSLVDVEQFYGAALFIDITGFSELTERLAEEGPAGAERLSGILNRYFGNLVNITARHGGDVEYFAGDGALALWRATTEGQTDAAALHAARGAIALRNSLYASRPAADVELRFRIGLAAGEFNWCELGSEDQRHSLVIGDPIREAGEACAHAAAGEILLTPSAARKVVGKSQGEWTASGCFRMDAMANGAEPVLAGDPLPELPAAFLRGRVPRVVRERVEAGHGEWLAEFRNVSVIFGSLRSSVAPLAEDFPQLQTAVRALQEIISRFGGTLYQLLMDDKGLCFVGAFGLPLLESEELEARAVEAGIRLDAELRSLGFVPSVGITSGRTFCGACGSPLRRQYSIVGSPMNLAARLMQAAGEGVLCDAATKDALGNRTLIDESTAVSLKGWAKPVTAFRPRAHLGGRGLTTPDVIVGRDHEHAQLVSLLEPLRRGTGGLAWIEGEAGIGKSNLIGSFAERAREMNVRVLFGAGDILERATPYQVWRDIVFQLLDAGDNDESTIGHAIRARLDEPALADQLAVLNPVLHLAFPETDASESMVAEARAHIAKEIIVRLLHGEAQRAPLLIIIDDIHWLESTSLEVLFAVAERVRGALVTVAGRPLDEPAATTMQRVSETIAVLHLPLGRLRREDLPSLVAHALGVADIPPELATFVEERSEGHPFYAQELALAMREAGFIRITNGVCQLSNEKGFAGEYFGRSVSSVVLQRIEHLGEIHKLILKAASVIGISFDYDLLCAVYPVSTDQPRLRDGMLRILESGLVVSRPSTSSRSSYQFRHAIVRETAYGTLPGQARASLHRAVAEAYERRQAAGEEVTPSALAHHWDAAGESGRAVPYFEQAGEQAATNFANREVLSFFGRALELADAGAAAIDAERRSRWEYRLGDAAIYLSDYHRAMAHFRTVMSLLGYPIPTTPVQMALGTMKEIARQIWHRIGRGALGTPPEGERDRMARASIASKRYGEAGWFNNEQLSPLFASFRCLNFAERAGEQASLVDGYATIAIIVAMAGMNETARRYISRSRALRAPGVPIHDIGRIQMNYALNVGDWGLAREATELGCREYGRTGARFLWEACRAGQGYLNLLTGRCDDAWSAFQDTFESARYGALQARLWARAGQCATELTRDGLVRESLLADYETHLKYNTHETETTVARGLFALAALRAGDRQRAYSLAAEAVDRLRASRPNLYYTLWSISGCCEVALTLWEERGPDAPREVQMLARRACSVLSQFAWLIPIARPRAALHEAQLARLRGRRQGARRRRLALGMRHAERLAMPYDCALLEREQTQSGLSRAQ